MTTYSSHAQAFLFLLCRYCVQVKGNHWVVPGFALCAVTDRRPAEMGVDWAKVLQWEIHSRSELPSPLQSAWCKLNEVPHYPPLPNPSHFPSAERAYAGGWQRYNQFAIHHWPYFNFVWKWHWLLTPTSAIRPRRNIWNGQRVWMERGKCFPRQFS